MSRTWKWVLAVVVGIAVAIPAGTFVYINFIRDDPPARLTLESDNEGTPTTAAPAAGGDTTEVSGRWRPTSESVLGYRVKEVLLGQSAEGVGRTSDVTGSMTIDGASVDTVELVADMKTVKSDESRRDGQFQGRIMETATYPTATFKLTQPLVLSNVPTDNAVVDAQATGDLTLHGVTKEVSFTLKAQRDGAKIKVNGTIPIVFADFGIDNPSGGPARTEDNGLLEFTVVFGRAL